MRAALFALLLLTALARAAEPGVVEVPPDPDPKWVEFKVQPGKQLVLSSGAVAAKWVRIDTGAELRSADGKVATFTASAPGVYRCVVVPAGGDPQFVRVTVGDPGPGPGPGPGPKPPDPPVDALVLKLRAAFAADPADIDKRRNSAKDLAELYRQAAVLAADPAVGTSGALLEQVSKAAAALLKDPPAPGRKHLADVRKVVGAELGALLPTDDVLTDAQRKAVAELFAKLAVALEELAK